MLKSVVLSLLVAFTAAESLVNTDFLQYIKQHGKDYAAEELEMRAEIYHASVAEVNAHNLRSDVSYKKGINRFSDMTEAEKKEFKGSFSAVRLDKSGEFAAVDWTAPSSVDWRKSGAINAVKDQGQCGVCWAFAATSAAESAYFLHSKKLLSFSELQQVDCNKQGGCNECAFDFLKLNKICSEGSWPYKCGGDATCRSCTQVAPAIRSYFRVQSDNETALKFAVAAQPIAIGIVASGDFMSYHSGIFDGSCPGGIDHAVVIVGYGTENGEDFWIVRNSWNTGWGEQGYIRIKRNTGGSGHCMVAHDPSAPTF